MLCIKVKNIDAELTKKYLVKQKLLDTRYKVYAKNSFIYFPVLSKPKVKPRNFRFGFEDITFEPKGTRTDMVKRFIESHKERAKSFDILGNIAIVDTEPELVKKLAAAILKSNPNVMTVVRKGGAVSGVYRTRKYVYVAGKRDYTADYRENGCVFRFNINKTFFSTRLSYERKRITDLSKNGENVVVMFAGVGPFAIEIAKKNPKSKIVAIELNKFAHRYMLDNIRINKVKNVDPVCADVAKMSKKYNNFAERIVMPLPKDSASFMNRALKMAGKECTFHYYAFGPSEDPYKESMDMLEKIARKNRRRFRVVFKRIVRPYSKNTVEIVLDFVMKRI
jgi:tRNA (guanine37-N1)-methyltransferase